MHIFWLVLSIVALIALGIAIFRKIRPVWKKAFAIIVSLLILMFSNFKFLIPMKAPLETTGSYKITDFYKYYKHETKYKNMETSENERELPVRFWLPDDKYDKKFPLVIFSHGSFGTVESNESLFRELASHGYIIASIAHPHHSFEAKMSNGKNIGVNFAFMREVMSSQGSKNPEDTMKQFREWNGIRVEDINFIVDSIKLSDKPDKDLEKIDKDKIILSGHSLGGAAVLEVGRFRPEEFMAVISLEAPFFGDIKGIEKNKYVFIEEEYPLPVLHFYSDALWGKLGEITTYEMNQRLIDLDKAKFKNIHISGSGHIGLTDMSLLSPIITNLIDGGLNTKETYEKLGEINKGILEFLKGLE